MIESGLRLSHPADLPARASNNARLHPSLKHASLMRRDARVDVLRGLSLLMIFCDHIPGNLLSRVTLHNFGFADAAEAFVLLAGFSALAAYGRCIERDGWASGLMRIARRCWRIYLVQMGLIVASLAIVLCWSSCTGLQPTILKPLLDAPVDGLANALVLMAQPRFLDILPLYIALLALFPVIYLAMRQSLLLAVALSGGLWLAANYDHGITLPKWNEPEGWYFNPFAWQFLFTIGAVLARIAIRNGGNLPPRRWLIWACVGYLALAFFESFPWREWSLPDVRPFTMDPLDKSRLAWPRILNILALTYLVLSSRRLRIVADGLVFRAAELCGRHSLEVFATGCIFALFGRLAFRTAGDTVVTQISANAAGMAAMVLIAVWLDRRKYADIAQKNSLELRNSSSQGAAPTTAWSGI
jgi:hypothetical protein